MPPEGSLRSLRSGVVKAGDVLYTPPGMMVIDKIVNEDAVYLSEPYIDVVQGGNTFEFNAFI